MAKGRPRKQGKRTRSGQLSRAGKLREPNRIEGNARAVESLRRYRSNGHDPIGRAFETGLLGKGEDGKPSQVARVRLDTARGIYRAYWPILGVGKICCTLGDKSGGGDGNLKTERWLRRQMEVIGPMGTLERQSFDDLVLDGHFDKGPAWLDRLINRTEATGRDEQRLGLAIAVIDRLANIS